MIPIYCLDCGKELCYDASFHNYKRCRVCAMKHKWQNQEFRDKIITKESNLKKAKALKLRWKTTKYREIMSKIMNSNNYKIKVMKGIRRASQIKPNKPEKCLMILLDNLFGTNYKFVGDFKYFIGGFNPDFVDEKNKKIIELYGDYWHNRPEYKKRDERRLKVYFEQGYKTLIIWEHELINLKQVVNKLLEFTITQRRKNV